MNIEGVAAYELDGPEGLDILLGDDDLQEFLANNEFDDETVAAIKSLAVGGVYADGGGASPSWSIKRVK